MSWSARSVRTAPGLAVAVVLALLVASCSSPAETASPVDVADEAAQSDEDSIVVEDQTNDDQIVSIEPSESDIESAEVIADRVSAMTLEQKIGQLLMPVLAGTAADVTTEEESAQNRLDHGFDTPAEVVRQYQVGGVIYLENNVASAEQLRSLSRGLQSVAAESGDSGLLIAIDQEGGKVSRVSDGVTTFQSALELSGDAARVNEAAFITGQQLRYQGINVVLAPVADVLPENGAGFIGDRSYGSNPEVVSEMVQASVNGLQQSGVAAAAKHWPGHGPTTTDSHQSLPVLDMSKQDWAARDRLPFEAAIAQDVAIVLVGHLAVPQLDESGNPATTSDVIIQQLLKDDLRFDGVVMTDALNMGAVGGESEAELMVASVVAGADILLIPPSLETTVAALNEAVVDGRISQARLDDAVSRVLRLKQKLGLLE